MSVGEVVGLGDRRDLRFPAEAGRIEFRLGGARQDDMGAAKVLELKWFEWQFKGMKTTRLSVLILIILLSTNAIAQGFREQVEPLVTTAFAESVEELDDGVFLVVGLQFQDQQAVFGFGTTPLGEIPDGDTPFPIASLTKPLAALLVHLQVEAGLIALDDGVETCPDGLRSALCFDGQPVTWRHLLTHTSGLPQVPDNWGGDINNYTTQSWQEFLASYAPEAAPGTQFEYSTVGYGILSTYLATEESTFESLLIQNVLVPLGMEHTSYLRENGTIRLCQGLLASGGLESTVNDYLDFIRANLYPSQVPLLTTAIVSSQQVQADVTTFPMSVSALGWQVMEPTGWHWHGGLGAEHHSFAAFDTASHVGIVLTTNMDVPPENTDLEMAAFMLLGGLMALQ